MTLDIRKLRGLAEAAHVSVLNNRFDNSASDFIAAAAPGAVLALLDELEQMKTNCGKWIGEYEQAHVERSQLRAALKIADSICDSLALEDWHLIKDYRAARRSHEPR